MKNSSLKACFFQSIASLVLLLSPVYIRAQSENQEKCKFRSQILVGMLEGSSGSGFLVQSVSGIQHKSWFLGLGAGLDDYRFRGIPLFLDLRRSFYRPGGSYYVYADGGIHFIWPKDKDDLFYGKDQFQNGWYYDLGIGYAFRVLSHINLLISGGYSYKYVGDKSSYGTINPGGGSYQEKMRYDFDLHRLSFKIGIGF